MFARLLIICACAWTASGASIVETVDAPERLHLTCSGTLATPADRPGASDITADGVVDVAGGSVYGFGLGGQPIRALDAEEIAFGDAGQSGGRWIDGSIDRGTLETRITVYGGGDGADPLMVMRLACRIAAAST